MLSAKIILDKDFEIGETDRRLYGSFLEHIGRAIYGGIFQPGHHTADANGFRADALELVKELDVPVVRYPGGNFVSGYDWEDGIGPKDARPRRLDLAWHTIESNQIGTDEFIDWCALACCDPMIAVNLGTRGAEAALNLLEYCNHPSGTYWSDLRVKNGRKNPHGVKLWCLGNEMDGPWQICAKTAREYGRLANETAKLMKWADPSIELVACGSSGPGMATFADWEREVLELTYDNVDYISLHSYYENAADDTPDFLACGLQMDKFIKDVASICDAAGAKVRSKKRVHLSFDEWNVWFMSKHGGEAVRGWNDAPEQAPDGYTFEDALLVGSLLITLMNNCDRVKIACLAQLVNVIAPITTSDGGAWRQTIFYPFAHASRYGRGRVLRAVTESPKYDSKNYTDVPYLDAAFVHDEERGELTMFAVNRSLDEDMAVAVDPRGFGEFTRRESVAFSHGDLKAFNTERAPFTVAPRGPVTAACSGPAILGPVVLEKHSWNVVRFLK